MSGDGAWRSRMRSPRHRGPRRTGANVARATDRIKTDVQVDVVRSRCGRWACPQRDGPPSPLAVFSFEEAGWRAPQAVLLDTSIVMGRCVPPRPRTPSVDFFHPLPAALHAGLQPSSRNGALRGSGQCGTQRALRQAMGDARHDGQGRRRAGRLREAGQTRVGRTFRRSAAARPNGVLDWAPSGGQSCHSVAIAGRRADRAATGSSQIVDRS